MNDHNQESMRALVLLVYMCSTVFFCYAWWGHGHVSVPQRNVKSSPTVYFPPATRQMYVRLYGQDQYTPVGDLHVNPS